MHAGLNLPARGVRIGTARTVYVYACAWKYVDAWDIPDAYLAILSLELAIEFRMEVEMLD